MGVSCTVKYIKHQEKPQQYIRKGVFLWLLPDVSEVIASYPKRPKLTGSLGDLAVPKRSKYLGSKTDKKRSLNKNISCCSLTNWEGG